MTFDAKGLDDYIDVAQRIADFRESHPSGYLQPLDPAQPWQQATVTGYDKDGREVTQTFIVYVAAAYREPGDEHPGVGCAWEVFPGRTPYTRGSELMNAETSAWGRAIVACLASDSKRGVASREEVRNRAAERDDPPRMWLKEPETRPDGSATEAEQMRMVRGPVPGSERLRATPDDDPWYGDSPEAQPGSVTPQQLTAIHARLAKAGITDREVGLLRLESITGRPVGSSKELSFLEGERVKKELA